MSLPNNEDNQNPLSDSRSYSPVPPPYEEAVNSPRPCQVQLQQASALLDNTLMRLREALHIPPTDEQLNSPTNANQPTSSIPQEQAPPNRNKPHRNRPPQDRNGNATPLHQSSNVNDRLRAARRNAILNVRGIRVSTGETESAWTSTDEDDSFETCREGGKRETLNEKMKKKARKMKDKGRDVQNVVAEKAKKVEGKVLDELEKNRLGKLIRNTLGEITPLRHMWWYGVWPKPGRAWFWTKNSNFRRSMANRMSNIKRRMVRIKSATRRGRGRGSVVAGNGTTAASMSGTAVASPSCTQPQHRNAVASPSGTRPQHQNAIAGPSNTQPQPQNAAAGASATGPVAHPLSIQAPQSNAVADPSNAIPSTTSTATAGSSSAPGSPSRSAVAGASGTQPAEPPSPQLESPPPCQSSGATAPQPQEQQPKVLHTATQQVEDSGKKPWWKWRLNVIPYR
ncbi:hypothetical protein ACMFMG_010219 [Clarireedia jacksonii]